MTKTTRNPGPSWGYAFMRGVDRLLPAPLMRGLVRFGALVAMGLMPEQRRYSRAFLTDALRRRATWRDAGRHFGAFAEFLLERFRVAGGKSPRFRLSDDSTDRVETLARSGEQALYGTFHFGMSDLMGFWLSEFGVSLRMVRFQVENSDDLAWLGRRFNQRVGFIWVNQPGDMLFALKDALAEGHSVALKCDRVQHSSKREVFEFLGKPRQFPFAIYHLSILFDLPVVFAFGVQSADGEIEVFSSSIYRPDRESKTSNLAAARAHFEGTLKLLETLIEKRPYQWFNFLDAVPAA